MKTNKEVARLTITKYLYHALVIGILFVATNFIVYFLILLIFDINAAEVIIDDLSKERVGPKNGLVTDGFFLMLYSILGYQFILYLRKRIKQINTKLEDVKK